MKTPRIMIGATGSGSGKTMITCSLLQILKEQNQRIAAFKCGPDYIDPMFHSKVLDVPSKNLDTFFTGEELTRKLFLEDARGKDISVIEGVMGLYDGIGGIREEASSYHLAKVTKTPIILVVNARGMGRSILPLLSGFLEYDKEHLIKGVILNQVSAMFYQVIKEEIEANLPIAVVGYCPVIEELTVKSRYLGLTLPEELGEMREQIERAAGEVQNTINMEMLIQIAEEAEDLEDCNMPFDDLISCSKNSALPIPIGIAMDEGFCFYYKDNLRLLEKMGAELIPFSPIHDEQLPKGIKGIILGGGYPELYGEELSQNTSMKSSIATAIRQNMPTLAECGGFMYLHEELENCKKQTFPMVSAIKGKAYDSGKLVRFGYIEITEKKAHYLNHEQGIKGHEFHYYDSSNNGNSCIASKPMSKRSWECVHAQENNWWGFPHLYYYSNPQFVGSFLEKAGNYEIPP